MEQKDKKSFNLEERTLAFARAIREFIKTLPRTVSSIEDGKQLVRSSGSVGANYIEANEALSRKDFVMRIKIARKEAKESCYWLKLIETQKPLEEKRASLEREAVELTKILSAILLKSAKQNEI